MLDIGIDTQQTESALLLLLLLRFHEHVIHSKILLVHIGLDDVHVITIHSIQILLRRSRVVVLEYEETIA